MNPLKYAAIRVLDFACHLTGHRWYRVCCWIGEHPWWQDKTAELIRKWKSAQRAEGGGRT